MARDPSQGPYGEALQPRQRHFGEGKGDDGWTLIGPQEESIRADSIDEPIAPPAPAEPRPIVPPELATIAEPVVDPAAVDEGGPEPRSDPFAAVEIAAQVAPPVAATQPEPWHEIAAPEPERETPRAAPPAARHSVLPLWFSALTLIALGLLAWRHARVVRALEGDLADERARAAVLASATDSVEGNLQHLRAEVERLEGELSDVSRRAAQADAAAEREGTARRRADELAAERDGLRGELASARQALSKEQERAAASTSRLDALHAELEQVRKSTPAATLGEGARRAEVCDRMLTRLEAEQGAAARAVLDAALSAGLFAPGARDGTEFLEELVSAAQAFERARVERATTTGPAAGAVLAALGHTRQARAGLADLRTQAGDWLELDVLGGALQPPGARARRIEAALERLEDEGANLGGDIEALHASDWTWIAARGALQDPSLAHAHALDFACGHRGELATQAAERLTAECIVEGTPQPERLLAAGCLQAWAALLAGADERSGSERELLWLDAARRWYAADAAAIGFEWHGLEPPSIEQRGRDWRAELWLRVHLAAPESAWPPRRGEFALYEVSGPSRARWRSDRCVEADARDGWTWLRTHLDEQGAALGEPATVRVERVGERSRLSEADLVLLDLRAAQQGCEVAPAPLPSPTAPPAAFGRARAEWLARAAATSRDPCLVVRQGDTIRWFSPRMGLVLEERELPDGPARVELVLREVAP